MLAVSMDDADTLRRFKQELRAPYPFVADPEGSLAERYGVRRGPVAGRHTFVIGERRRILKVESGADALDPDDVVAACPARRPPPPAQNMSATPAE